MSVEQERDVTDAGGFDVSDKMYRISEATNTDGTVDVDIFDYNESGNGEHIHVKFRTPTGDTKTERMDFPKKDSPEYKFVRVCRKTVGGLNAAKFLKTDGAEITANPENWEIDAELGKFERFKAAVSAMTFKEAVGMGVGALDSAIIIFIFGAMFIIPLYGIATWAGAPGLGIPVPLYTIIWFIVFYTAGMLTEMSDAA